jgi:DNA-binding IclR family transcriptional regulator
MATLESQLTALTLEFVGKLVEAIRNASFAEVAGLSLRGPTAEAKGKRVVQPAASAPRGRQTASLRAELGDRVLDALRAASGPLGVRALASELRVPTDRLAVPLRELRSAGKIRKHGEKRSTTYSAA